MDKEQTGSKIVKRFEDRLMRKDSLVKPGVVEYRFKPEITKIFGKGGILE